MTSLLAVVTDAGATVRRGAARRGHVSISPRIMADVSGRVFVRPPVGDQRRPRSDGGGGGGGGARARRGFSERKTPETSFTSAVGDTP